MSENKCPKTETECKLPDRLGCEFWNFQDDFLVHNDWDRLLEALNEKKWKLNLQKDTWFGK